jgi:hypothetical protein
MKSIGDVNIINNNESLRENLLKSPIVESGLISGSPCGI